MTTATVVRLRRMYIRGPLGLYPYGSRQNFPITREKRGRNLVKCQRLSRHEFPQKSGEAIGQTATGGTRKKCSLLARLRAHDALASHAHDLQHD